ncbi:MULTISPECIES: hypothetical protein [Marinobacter]|uniref:Uncharacterized protein n=1 Tax=Marinobacter xiaoshiensis TaxID=3073652 RepID=A0ABU2HKB4_9GAMM|nr:MULTISPECIES: hypothetical protein [unclassified Marinobacter]MBK1874257.1 hypothetical protein [Marinobacter sp. 1-3A]MBK1886622.1 hypothetical protein [Marinobacter sp. DY40_1A1]MDS1311509.1 hypothetical protein [Marinobacter sp. F60267]
MSLLTSLIQASTRFQQTLEKRPVANGADEQKAKGTASAETLQPSGPGDDRFTPSGELLTDAGRPKSRKLPLSDYKQTVGQDLAFIRETLRHKLAEYNLNPSLSISVNKNDSGRIEVGGNLAEETRSRIEKDLNVNKNFADAFSRLSVNEPTLHFMDNALKLSQAYGVNNSLLDTLISENQQFNGLQDLVHRYDTLRRSAPTDQFNVAANRGAYAFNLNTRA